MENGLVKTYDLNCYDISDKLVRAAKGCSSVTQAQNEWRYIVECQERGSRWAKVIVRHEIVEGKLTVAPNGKKPFGLKL